MTEAYSLIRMSTPQQAGGDSIRRQELLTASESFCAERGLTLNGTLRVIGKSAYHGDHVASGPLAEFIALVHARKIKPGSWLIVEDMDRLDRRKVNVALRQFLSLLEAGITIHTVIDNQTYTLDRVNEDQTALIISIVKMAAAHDYSKKLAGRITKKWEARRAAMREGKGVATNACPRWLRAENGKFVRNPERVEVIKRIIAMRHAGLGRHAIASTLNAEKVPTFNGGDGWHGATIFKLVTFKALIGIYEPHKSDKSPDGDPIAGYYPRIISDEDFYRAQWGEDNKVSKGRKSKGFANLLPGVCKCTRCGAGLVYVNTGNHQFLVCGKYRRGMCDNGFHRTYPKLEMELLSAMILVDYRRLLAERNPDVDRVFALEAEIAEKEATIDRLLSDFAANTPAAVTRRISALSENVEQLRVQLEEAKRLAKIEEAREHQSAYAEFTHMVEGMPTMEPGEKRDRLRMRLTAELRRMIESATADGTELAVRLRGSGSHSVDLVFERSIFSQVRFTSDNPRLSFTMRIQTCGAKKCVLGRDGLAGMLAGLIGGEPTTAVLG